jgi:hypothetical protein
MRKLKYVKLFEAYTDTDFETGGNFTGKLDPEHQKLLDDLKDMFIDGSFKGVSSSDSGVVFKFAFYQPTTILYVFVDDYSSMVSVEHPNNASENINKEFKFGAIYLDPLNFIRGLGRLKKYMK